MADTPIYVGEWILNLLNSIPELKGIYDKVRDPKTGKFLYTSDAISDMIMDSNWYRTNGPTVASRIMQKLDRKSTRLNSSH